jgi:hypothetical protein
VGASYSYIDWRCDVLADDETWHVSSQRQSLLVHWFKIEITMALRSYVTHCLFSPGSLMYMCWDWMDWSMGICMILNALIGEHS